MTARVYYINAAAVLFCFFLIQILCVCVHLVAVDDDTATPWLNK